jgi:hypothetical protein
MSRIATLALALMIVAVSSRVTPAEFTPIPSGSADQTTTVKDFGSVEGRVFALGTRIRLENDFGVGKRAAIMDLEKRQAWMLKTPPKPCVQTPLNEDTKNPSAWPPPESKLEVVGSERIDGHPTRKYKVTRTVGGEKVVSYIWRATDLNDWVIRVTNENGDFEIRYHNIRLETPDPALFEPPADCVASSK